MTRSRSPLDPLRESARPAWRARALSRWLASGMGLLCLVTAPRAEAAPPRPPATRADAAAPSAREALPLPDAGERSADPIGLDDSTGRELDRAAERLDEARRKAQQVVRTQSAIYGEVLTSLDAVNEVAHRVRVTLAQGLAFVEAELVFASRSATPAELAYRLALPAEAAVYAIKACRFAAPKSGTTSGSASGPARCTDALPEAAHGKATPTRVASDLPSASARAILDARGPALSLRAAAIDKANALSLRIWYVAPAPLHGGVVRFRLPARGYDPRIAQSEVNVQSVGLADLQPATALTLDAHLPLDLSAQLAEKPAPKSVSTHARCGGAACSRRYEAAANAPLSARPTWLLLDTSPSMQGPARNAADLALASLLSALPEQSRLRAFAFASRVQELGSFTPDAAPLKRLSDALLTDLGASTQPARVLEVNKAELASQRPRVLLLSDGKLDRGTLSALSSFVRRGVDLWLIALTPVDGALGAHFTGVVDAATSDGPALDERLRAALAPRAPSGISAGEQRVHESGPKKPYVPRAGEDWLSFWLARRAPPAFSTRSSAPPGYVAAAGFEAAPPKTMQPDTGMPKESVLSMLRTQLIPEARACLRTDRKGRADYAVNLTFHALFADREAYDVQIEGRIPDPLRRCLGEVVGRLRIPAFSGRIRVRYPIHTERELEAPVIELEGEALEQVNKVISGN